MANLIHIIYASKETEKLDDAVLFDLLARSKRDNQRRDVTGMLLYDQGCFLQILEGEKETVEKLFDKIQKDKRHTNVVIIIKEAIAERRFSDWSMGHAAISCEDLKKIEGLNDFFVGGQCLGYIDKGRAKKILHAFSVGRWHLS